MLPLKAMRCVVFPKDKRSKYNKINCVKALIELNANFQVRSSLDNQCPYDVAMYYGNRQICTYLIDLAKSMAHAAMEREKAKKRRRGKENRLGFH